MKFVPINPAPPVMSRVFMAIISLAQVFVLMLLLVSKQLNFIAAA
jgi:hypothetical protein